MQILPVSEEKTKLKGFKLEHNGVIKTVLATIYDNMTFSDVNEMFMDINAFWKTLPYDRQGKIFAVYEEIFHAFDTIVNSQTLLSALRGLVAKLYKCWNHNALCRFIDENCLTAIPEDIPDTVGEFNAEMTYTRKDYRELIHMIIALRPVTVIWSICTRTIQPDSGTNFKEYDTLRIINDTPIVTSAAYVKFTQYINAHYAPEETQLGHVYSNIGSAETPVWLRATALIRKISVANVYHYTDRTRTAYMSMGKNHNVIASVYKSMSNKMTMSTRSPNSAIHDKVRPGEFREDDKESIAEGIQTNQKLSESVMLGVKRYVNEIDRLRFHLDPTIPLLNVERCYAHLQRRDDFIATPEQMALCQWAINKVLGAKYIPLLHNPERLKVFALAQAFYWHWGYPEIALLLTAKPIRSVELPTRANNHLGRVPDDQLRMLMKYYSHTFPTTSVGDTTNQLAIHRKHNVALSDIEHLYDAMATRPYILIAPRQLLALNNLPGYKDGGNCVPVNFKQRLAEYVIQLQMHLEDIRNQTKTANKG